MISIMVPAKASIASASRLVSEMLFMLPDSRVRSPAHAAVATRPPRLSAQLSVKLSVYVLPS